MALRHGNTLDKHLPLNRAILPQSGLINRVSNLLRQRLQRLQPPFKLSKGSRHSNSKTIDGADHRLALQRRFQIRNPPICLELCAGLYFCRVNQSRG